MRIASCFQTTVDEIDAKRWNPYLGISINKKTFSREYLDAFLDWSLPRSSQKVAIVLVDVLQQINNQVFDRSKPATALEKAFRKADELRTLCQAAVDQLDSRNRDKVVLLEWPDIIDEQFFLHNACVFNRAFEEDLDFRNALMELSRQNLGSISERLGVEQLEHISRYILYELPELITGFVYDSCHFNLNVYPGAIFSVYEQLRGLDCFARLAPELRIIGPFASAEAYLE